MSFEAPLLFPYKPRGQDNIKKKSTYREPQWSYTIFSACNVLHHFEIFPDTVKPRQLSSWLLNLHVLRGSLLYSSWHLGRGWGWENRGVLTPLNAYSSVFTAMKYVCNRHFSTIWTIIKPCEYSRLSFAPVSHIVTEANTRRLYSQAIWTTIMKLRMFFLAILGFFPELHFFFWKNIFYKNIEAEICEILRIF